MAPPPPPGPGRPQTSLCFNSGACHFHKWQTSFVPEHHHFKLPDRFVLVAVPETIVFKIHFRSSRY